MPIQVHSKLSKKVMLSTICLWISCSQMLTICRISKTLLMTMLHSPSYLHLLANSTTKTKNMSQFLMQVSLKEKMVPMNHTILELPKICSLRIRMESRTLLDLVGLLTQYIPISSKQKLFNGGKIILPSSIQHLALMVYGLI